MNTLARVPNVASVFAAELGGMTARIGA